MKLLLVGEEVKSRRLVAQGFALRPYEVHTASSCVSVESLVGAHAFQAACVDLTAKAINFSPIIAALRQRLPQLPIVALVGPSQSKNGGALREQGVCAQVKSPFSIDVLRKALATHALPEPVGGKRIPVSGPLAKSVAPTPVAVRPQMAVANEMGQRTFEAALRAATSNAGILILGETGTGKSILAQTIHEHSPLKQRPFVAVGCAGLERELLESELFGQVRGAFTGAGQDTWGKVAAAEGGTLFLDEIGDLPATLQSKLLRLLQEKRYERIGEKVSRTANVRIVAATARDLKAEVAAGKFREDLYYRLNVISIQLPPLRERTMDIMPVARALLDRISRQMGRRTPGFTPQARQLFENYSWPGNLRELHNALERAATLSASAALDVSDFPSLVQRGGQIRCQIGAAVSLQCVEEAHIQAVIEKSSSLEEATRILGIDKSTLYRRRKAMERRVTSFPTQAVTMTGTAAS